MSYFQAMILPVRENDRAAYLAFAAVTAPLFAEHGALRTVETWEEEVMAGTVTDLRKAVVADAAERIVFSWIWWPDRAKCDAAWPAIMADARMVPDGPYPYDGARMVYGGFEAAFDSGDGGRFGYVDAIAASVLDDGRARFVDHAASLADLFHEQGALRLVDGWGADVPDGKVTDYKLAVQAKDGETVVVGWIEWPDKPTRDAGMAALMNDARMREASPPWNGKLAIFGGFTPILDTSWE